MTYTHGMLSPQELAGIFHTVDKDGDGEINVTELQSALSNGTWVPFNPSTVKLMINMFDRRGAGTIRLEEFGALWKYVIDWQNCFRAFDRDNSGFIDVNELEIALTTFGYRLSHGIVNLMLFKFDRQQKGQLAFDDFIQCCVVLYTITGAFRELDQDRDGVITINYEEFIGICLSITS